MIVQAVQSKQMDLPLRMSQAEARLFADLLEAGTFYLEWGSGGSTLAAVRSKVRQIVSVETDHAWIDRLKQHEEIADAISAKRLVFRHVDVGAVGQWGVPIREEKVRNWPRYAVDPFVATDLNFDVILVDGRFPDPLPACHCQLCRRGCIDIPSRLQISSFLYHSR